MTNTRLRILQWLVSSSFESPRSPRMKRLLRGLLFFDGGGNSNSNGNSKPEISCTYALATCCCVFLFAQIASSVAPAPLSYTNVCFTPTSTGTPYDPTYSPFLSVPLTSLPLTICSISFTYVSGTGFGCAGTPYAYWGCTGNNWLLVMLYDVNAPTAALKTLAPSQITDGVTFITPISYPIRSPCNGVDPDMGTNSFNFWGSITHLFSSPPTVTGDLQLGYYEGMF